MPLEIEYHKYSIIGNSASLFCFSYKFIILKFQFSCIIVLFINIDTSLLYMCMFMLGLIPLNPIIRCMYDIIYDLLL